MHFSRNINTQTPAFVFTVFQTPFANDNFIDWQSANVITSDGANICFKRAVLCISRSLIDNYTLYIRFNFWCSSLKVIICYLSLKFPQKHLHVFTY